jgi:DNA-directed RNA polymerase subunit beta'
VHLHAKITARIPQIDEHGIEVSKRFETTPGRVRLGSLLPKKCQSAFSFGQRLNAQKRCAARD